MTQAVTSQAVSGTRPFRIVPFERSGDDFLQGSFAMATTVAPFSQSPVKSPTSGFVLRGLGNQLTGIEAQASGGLVVRDFSGKAEPAIQSSTQSAGCTYLQNLLFTSVTETIKPLAPQGFVAATPIVAALSDWTATEAEPDITIFGSGADSITRLIFAKEAAQLVDGQHRVSILQQALGYSQAANAISKSLAYWDAFNSEDIETFDAKSIAQIIESFSDYTSTAKDYWQQRAIQSAQPDTATRIAHRLDQLNELETDDEAVLPSPRTIAAAKAVACYLPGNTVMPRIEIDDSVGSISLIWKDAENKNSFSLEFPNDQMVLGIGAGPVGRQIASWRCDVADQRRIQANLESSKFIGKLLSGT